MRLLPVAALMIAAVAVATAVAVRGHEHRALSGGTPIPISDVSESANELDLQAGSQRSLGAFRLSRGRSLDLATASTTDGKSCLLESSGVDPDGSVCSDGGLFVRRKVAFAIESQGRGPDAVSELHVAGVVAPEIRSAELLKSDGSSSQLLLRETGAFVYESPSSELARGVFPSGFRLYGASGKLVQSVQFPAGQ